jgi:hypothetical protein
MEITDKRTGEVHDFTKKKGVLHAQLIIPGGGTEDRAAFWNRIEHHHKRGDAVVSREIEVSLPRELTSEQRKLLAVGYASELAKRYGVVADIALHEPDTVHDRDLERDPKKHWEIDPVTGRRHNGNWHAHIMLSACSVSADGTLGKKVVELDPIHCQKHRIRNMVEFERARWADLENGALELHGHDARVDHRSLIAQGIFDREPQQHLGPAACQIERRTGRASDNRMRQEEVSDRLLSAKRAGELERQSVEVGGLIIDLQSQLFGAMMSLRDAPVIEKKTATAERNQPQEKTAMPSYFPPSTGDHPSLWPSTEDEPPPLLLLEQQYAANHQQKMEARQNAAGAKEKSRLQQQQVAAFDQRAAAQAEQQQPRDATPTKDR